MTAGPAFVKAMAGRTNRPELIIAPAPTENTSSKPSCFRSLATLRAINSPIRRYNCVPLLEGNTILWCWRWLSRIFGPNLRWNAGEFSYLSAGFRREPDGIGL